MPNTTIKLETNSNLAVMGDVELTFTIADRSVALLESASATATATHPTLSGRSISGADTEQVGGKYAIKANFSDSGTCKIMAEIIKGDQSDKQSLPCEIK